MFSASTSMKKRSSFITHAAEHEQDYTIKAKTHAELIDLLNEFGLLVEEQDLRKPTPARTTLLFECFISLLRPWRIPFIDAERTRVIKRSQAITGVQETQTFAEALVIYKEFKKLLQQIRFSQFELSDLLKPKSERIVPIINAVVNYGMFTEHAWEVFGPVAENSDQLALQATEAQEEENEIQAKIDERRLQMQEEENEAQKLREENEALAVKAQAMRAESDELLAEKDRLKKTRAQLRDNLIEVHFNALNLYEERKRYTERANFDVDKVKKSIAALRKDNDAKTKERDQLNETIKSLDNELKCRKSVINTVTKLDQIVTTIGNFQSDIERHKKTNEAINAEILNLETTSNDLQRKLTYVERNLEQTNLNIATLEEQQEKKRESMKAFYDESQARTDEVDELYQIAVSEAAEIDLKVEDLQNKVNALRIEHQKNMFMLEEKYSKIQLKIDGMHIKSEDIQNSSLS